MKRIFLLMTMCVAFVLQSVGEVRNTVPMQLKKRGHPDNSAVVHRSPMAVPVDVFYNPDLLQISIEGEETLDMETYVYDSEGVCIGYSSSANSTIDLPESAVGIISIVVESEGWYATGEISL